MVSDSTDSSCTMNARHWASLCLLMEASVHRWVSWYHCITGVHKICKHRDYTYTLCKAIWFPLNSKHAVKIWCDDSKGASSRVFRTRAQSTPMSYMGRLAWGCRLHSQSAPSRLVLTVSGSGLWGDRSPFKKSLEQFSAVLSPTSQRDQP